MVALSSTSRQVIFFYVIQGPIFVSMGKVQTCFMMFGKEKGAFGLYDSLHLSFFKVRTNCARGERLINNVGEVFGNLNSISVL